MRLTIVLLIIGLHIQARGLSQERVTLNVKDASLESVLKAISKQTGYQYALQDQWKGVAKRVDITVTDAAVADVLETLFKDQPFSYTIVGKIIVVKKREVAAEAVNADDFSPNLPEITGVVKTENGEPLAGATIKIRGGKVVAITDKDGSFVLRNYKENAVLEVSYTGYAAEDVRINNQTHLVIVLKLSSSKLDEVQVIAYGTTTQRYNVGSVSKVSAADIAEQPVINPLQALEGRVPGLVASQTSGIPGAAVTVQIRGQNSLNPNPYNLIGPLDQPLFIVDGVPFAPQNNNIDQGFGSLANSGGGPGSYFNNPRGGTSPFTVINPSDIESIEVLRDADATAIYGSRGSNGVILITTKKGKAGKTKASANVWTGESHITRTMPMMNIQQYLQMRHEAFANDGATPDSLSAPDLYIYDTTRNVDWKKYFLGNTAHTIDANASISGGNANTQFLIGSGYHHETYIFPGGFSANRASVNANIKHASTDHRLMLNFSVNYGYTENNTSGSPQALLSFTLPPNYPPLLNPDGSLLWNYKGFDQVTNPFAYLKVSALSQAYSLISSFLIGYQIFSGLTLRSNFGYTTFNTQNSIKNPLAAQDPSQYPVASASFGTNNYLTWIIEPQAEYVKSIFNGRLNILIGETFQKNSNRQNVINGIVYTNDALLGSISSAAKTTASDNSSLYKYSGAFGRINYIWNTRYIFDLTGRRDGSSRFGPGRQFGNFGSVGAGWIFSEESFVKRTLTALSFGKVHVSYGTTGSDGVGDYQYIANWSSTASRGGMVYQGVPGYLPVNLFNPNFNWSLNKKLEAGIELGLLKDRIFINATVYQNRCGNQLVSYQLPSQTGFGNVTQNFPALVQNRGLELQISSTNIKIKDFIWTTALNLSIPSNKLVSFPGIQSSSYASTYIVGKSLSIIQGFKYLGVNDTTGIFQFASKAGPTSSPAFYTDYHVIGNSDPKYFGGIKNSFSYKGFQLDLFIEFRKQLGVNYARAIYNEAVGFQMNQPTIILNRWKKPGDNAAFEKYTQFFGSDAFFAGTNYTFSDAAYSDASFIRFKTLSFSYSVNSNYLKKLKMDGCRIYVNMQNLFTITHYKGNDPETQDFYGVPPLRTIVAGLNLSF